jgi:hypothetical protein
VLQVNGSDVFVLGGTVPSLVAREYDVMESCIRVNIRTGLIDFMAPMKHGRYNHTACFIYGHVYVIGGENKNYEAELSCERYSIANNNWRDLPCDFDEFASNATVAVIGNRHLYAFGGHDFQNNFPTSQLIRHLDTHKMGNGWWVMSLKDPLKRASHSCAVINDTEGGLLLVGGFNRRSSVDLTQSFTTNPNDFFLSSKLQPPGANLCRPDHFRQN